MSEIFHKSCYTSRSTGYKYRTLSTNTGDKKRRDSQEDNTFDRKLREIKREIYSRVDKEVYQMRKARESIQEKFNKIDAKVSSMIEQQATVTALRKDLQKAECTLAGMLQKVDKIETASSQPYSLQSRKSSFRSRAPTLYEEKEISSTITHV